MSDFEIVGIDASQARPCTKVWDYVERGLAQGSLDTVERQKDAVEQGQMQLWAAFRQFELVGGFTTEILDFPLDRVCVIVAAAGDAITADGCEEALKQITPWARSLGCNLFEINGRAGWGKHLKGWTLAHVTHRRAI